jgi:lysophospholipase L1-like esterase
MISASKQSFTTGSRYLSLDFSGVRAVRDYKLVLAPGLYFGGLAIGPIDTIYPPKSAYIKLIGEGDSYMQDSTATMPLYNNASVAKLGLYLDADYGCFPMGGTGYTAINGTYPNMQARIGNVTQAHNGKANIVLVAAGINDVADSTLYPAALSYFQKIRADMPDALFVVVGTWCPIETNTTTYRTGRTIPIFNAVRKSGGEYILLDNIAGTFETSWGAVGSLGGQPWQTGTGRIGTTTGVGNGDVYRTSVDTTHASAEGYEYLSDRILFGISAAIATLN